MTSSPISERTLPGSNPFLPAARHAERTLGDSRGGPSANADPREFQDRLQGECGDVRTVSLVQPYLRQIAHPDRMRSHGVEPGGSVDPFEIAALIIPAKAPEHPSQ